jgi:hypothetical protein
MNLDKDWYTVRETSEITGLSMQLISDYMKRRRILYRKEKGKRLINKTDVNLLMNGKLSPLKLGRKMYPSNINYYEGYFGIVASNTGNEFYFDLNMLPKLSNYHWNENGNGYLQSTINRKSVFAHHLVIGKPPKGFIVDHKDTNRCNCLNSNLRFITIPENGVNAKLSSRNSSGFKGVTYDRARNKWMARISKINLGRFEKAEDAARAYDNKVIELYGDIALTNKKLGLLP